MFKRLNDLGKKKLGYRLVDTDDQIVIKPVDSDVDKIVDALLAEKEEAA